MNQRRNLLKLAACAPSLYLLNKYGFGKAGSTPPAKLLTGLCSIGDYVSDTSHFEQYVNFNHDILQYFSSFDTRVSPDMITPYFVDIPLKIWNSGRVPFLTWYPLTSNAYPTPIDICQRICNREYDSYLLLCCKALLKFFNFAQPDSILGSPKIYLRFAHEMNLSTCYYSDPESFVEMWIYVFNFLRNNGITKEKLLFIFCPNSMDVGTPPFEAFYPGDAYVDWNGLDGYNWGTTYVPNTYWKSFEDIFTPALNRMMKLSAKPISICEFGSTSKVLNGYDLEGKKQWLADAYQWLSNQNNLSKYNIKMAIYYNVSKLNDIDSGLFIPNDSVLDSNTFDYIYQNYMTLNGLNTFYMNKAIGFKNNNVLITISVFNGKF